jgi:hypothetical protein
MPQQTVYKCYAPVFPPSNCWACFWLTLIYTLVIIELGIILIIAIIAGPEAVRKIACLIKQFLFRIKYCKKGNDDPNKPI